MAVISLLFPATFSCASNRLLADAHALTRWVYVLRCRHRCSRAYICRLWQPLRRPSILLCSWSCDKGTVQFLGIQHADYPVESVVRRYPVRQVEEFLKPVNLGVAVVLYLIPAFSSADDCAKRYKQDGFKTVFLRPKDSWDLSLKRRMLLGYWCSSYLNNGYRPI